MLRQMGDSLVYIFDMQEACQKIVNILFDDLLPDNCSLMLYDYHTQTLELYVVKSRIPFKPDTDKFAAQIGHRFKVGEGAAGWSLEQKRIVYIPDTEHDERFVHLQPLPTNLRSIICIPLIDQQKPEGVINISYSAPNAFPAERIPFLNILMQDIGLFIGNIRLFSDLKRANLALQETNDNLHKILLELHKTQQYIFNSERLSGVNLLAAGIAHEFNNIFAAIMGYSELCLLKPDLDEHKRTFETVIKLSHRATTIVTNLLTFAGKERMLKTNINLNNELRLILDFVRPELEKSSIIVKKRFGDIPFVICDRNQISRVFLHIISNAKDAMEPNGGILSIRTRPKDDMVIITISDTGKGIEPHILRNIFKPFATTKGSFGGGRQNGIGMGLSVSYGIIKSHGGNISVSSKIGSGTSIKITLPHSKKEDETTSILEPIPFDK
jgi:signal transduction histidine kinase